MNTYEGMEVHFHSFLTLSLVGVRDEHLELVTLPSRQDPSHAWNMELAGLENRPGRFGV
jgi:hypothetical protein